ncbi:MAG: 6-phosphofructo-2-kinase/fructose-2,6-bisphosphatase [Myxococcota bacterium]
MGFGSRQPRHRLAIVMVGLPARGKTHIARRIVRYLNWKGVNARIFNVGSYRRERIGAHQPHSFFDPDNPEGRAARHAMAAAALADVRAWFAEGGEVAIYDATNITRARRRMVAEPLEADGVEVVFLESVCNDPSIIENNVRQTKIRMPDYKGVDPEEAVADFRHRISHYATAYEPLDDTCRYIRLVDVGRQVVVNRIRGWLLGGVVNLLTCLHLEPRTIYLSRHGESEYNALGRIGGDSSLTRRGEAYAHALTERLTATLEGDVEVWTSTLVRTRSTARDLPWPQYPLKELDEIDAGRCDGMTYDEIRDQMPGEYAARKADKLRYRYPRGESYVDVVNRLEPVILEMERHRGPLVVVAHQAVIRVLYGYFTNQPSEAIPHVDIPLHTLIELTPIAYGAEERRLPLIP